MNSEYGRHERSLRKPNRQLYVSHLIHMLPPPQVLSREPEAVGATESAQAALNQLLSSPKLFATFSDTAHVGQWVATVVVAPNEPWLVGMHHHTADCRCQSAEPKVSTTSTSETSQPALGKQRRDPVASANSRSVGDGVAEATGSLLGSWEVSNEHHKMRIARFLSAQGIGNMEVSIGSIGRVCL
eukprot:scaffold372996_cov21-Prasinocladus_malaysianus.AAC.1